MVADNDYVVEVGFPVKFDALKLQMKTKARCWPSHVFWRGFSFGFSWRLFFTRSRTNSPCVIRLKSRLIVLRWKIGVAHSIVGFGRLLRRIRFSGFYEQRSISLKFRFIIRLLGLKFNPSAANMLE